MLSVILIIIGMSLFKEADGSCVKDVCPSGILYVRSEGCEVYENPCVNSSSVGRCEIMLGSLSQCYVTLNDWNWTRGNFEDNDLSNWLISRIIGKQLINECCNVIQRVELFSYWHDYLMADINITHWWGYGKYVYSKGEFHDYYEFNETNMRMIYGSHRIGGGGGFRIESREEIIEFSNFYYMSQNVYSKRYKLTPNCSVNQNITLNMLKIPGLLKCANYTPSQTTVINVSSTSSAKNSHVVHLPLMLLCASQFILRW